MVDTCPACGQSVRSREIRIDLATNTLMTDGLVIQLLPTEAEIMYALKARPEGMTRWELTQSIYGYRWDEISDGTLRTWVSRLRKKLADTPFEILPCKRVYRLTAKA